MSRDSIPDYLALRVPSGSLRSFAVGAGWVAVNGVKSKDVAVYHRSDSKLHQVRIPVEEGLDDYPDLVRDAIVKLADQARRPAAELLNQLLLPPSDLLRFRQISSESETGVLPLEQSVRLLTGVKRSLLAAAHGALNPQAYHPRMSGAEAEEYVGRCRLTQTERGSFVFGVSCPLDVSAQLFGEEIPYGRRVTGLLMDTLDALNGAEFADPDLLPRLKGLPGISANLCESLLLLRSEGERSQLTVSASWSKSLPHFSGAPERVVPLRQETFDLAENLAVELRSVPEPRKDLFVAKVDELRGEPAANDPRPSGEVIFSLLQEAEIITASARLPAEDYSVVGGAHLSGGYVSFSGILRRLPRMSRLENLTDLRRIEVGTPKSGGA